MEGEDAPPAAAIGSSAERRLHEAPAAFTASSAERRLHEASVAFTASSAERRLREEVASLQTLLLAVTPPPGVSIERLRALAVARALAPEDTLGADPRDVKLLDLARRNRALTVALNRAREECTRAARAAPPQPPEASGMLLRGVDAAASAAAERARSLHSEQMQASNAALTLQRDAALAELRQTRAALAREVDPTLSLGQLLRLCGIRSCEAASGGAAGEDEATNAGWRGRGQQLLVLKERLRSVEQRARSAEGSSFGRPAGPAPALLPLARQDVRAAEGVAMVAAARARRAEAAEAEVAQLRTELSDARQALAAVKARAETLTAAARTAQGTARLANSRAEAAQAEALQLQRDTECQAKVRGAVASRGGPAHGTHMGSSSATGGDRGALAAAAAANAALERLVAMLKRELASERAACDELREQLRVAAGER